MEYRIDDLLDEYLDETVPMETMAYTSANTIKEMTMKKIRNENTLPRRKGHKRMFTVALAAALVFALSITAFAVYNIHQQQQEELRSMLQVDENHVSSYVEYDAEGTEGVTLLSAIHDGDFQRVYVAVSPVTEEEARKAIVCNDTADAFYFTTNYAEGYGSAQVPFDSSKLTDEDLVTVKDEDTGAEFQTYDMERITQLSLEDSYDAETQTLTLCLNLWDTALSTLNGSEPVEVSVVRMLNGTAELYTYGTVTFTPTAAQLREIRFTEPVELYNEDLQESCRVIGVRLTPLSAAWLVEIENAQELYSGNNNLTAEQREAQVSWLSCTDVLSSAALIMDNGTEFKPGIIVADPYENGMVMPTTSWTTTIDINAVTAVRIQDQTVSCN